MACKACGKARTKAQSAATAVPSQTMDSVLQRGTMRFQRRAERLRAAQEKEDAALVEEMLVQEPTGNEVSLSDPLKTDIDESA